MSWLQEFYIANFSLFTCNFFLQLLSSRPIAQNVKVWFKKHAWELFQYGSVLFDNRFELNNDLKATVEMTRPNKHQSRQWRSQPRNLGEGKQFGEDKMFDFRRITLFCLEKRLSKYKMTICSKNVGGHGSFGPPGYAYESRTLGQIVKLPRNFLHCGAKF